MPLRRLVFLPFPLFLPSLRFRWACDEEYIKIVTNVSGNLDNLRRLEREQASQVLSAKLAHIKLCLAGTMLPFKKFAEVDAFKEQFAQIRARYKFLVIEGQSKTGKTYFTKWMLGTPDRVFETNCAACPEPELRDFNHLVHQIILFDEASPSMVIAQKKLFQGPPCFVELGCSTTNCHSYKVLVSGTMLVICSNGWSEAVAGMALQADKDWLAENSIVLNIGKQVMYGP